MNTTATDTKPWYQQFWFWFVIGIPGCSVIMGLTLLYVATQNKVSMVKDDWYKDGKAINQRIDKQLKARELGIAANITLSRETGALTVTIANQKQVDNTLLLTLIHPTTEDRDQSIELTLTPENNYWAKLPADQSGFYYLQLRNKKDEWQLDGAINFKNELVNIDLTAE